MANPFTVTFDEARLRRVMRRYIVASGKTTAEVINQKMYFISSGAMKLTKKADQAAMLHKWGHVADKVFYKSRKGEIKRYKRPKKVFAEQDTLIHRVALKQLRARTGRTNFTEQEQMEEVRAIRGSRLRGIGYVKAGFIPIIRTFKRQRGVGGSAPEGARAFGPPKGRATPAKDTPGMQFGFAEHFGLEPVTKNSQQPGSPIKFAMPALEASFAHEIAGMENYIAGKLQKKVDSHNWDST